MWWWWAIWIVIIWLLISSFGYYGYRRSGYYDSWGRSGGIGLLVALFVIFWLVVIFAGPWWGGWYGRGWYW
jgi:hypothetical protein